MKKCMPVLSILSLLLTGCWDRRELNELAISMAMGIDKVENEYRVTAQVVIPFEVSMKGGSARTSVTLFEASGVTVYEAIRKMTKISPRKIYPGHLRILVLGEELAREGIGESLDLIERDWEIRSDFYVVVARNHSAAEILNVTTPLEKIPANKMFNTLKTSEKSWAASKGFTLDELIADLTSDGTEAVLTGIEVKGNKEKGASNGNVDMITPAALIQFDHLAVFKNDKLVGWLNERETRGYNAVTNAVKSTVASIPCPTGGKATIEVNEFNSDVIGYMKNGKPEVDIHSTVVGNVGAVECKIDLTKPETLAELEKIYTQTAKKIIKEAIETAQKEYKSDIFGFGDAFHRSNPKDWRKLKEQWDETFPDVTVNVNVDMKIRGIGTINKTFLEKLKD